MEDSSRIKPYIAHLDSQLKKLGKSVEEFTSKPLDEQLLMLKDNRERLDLSNRYAYVLSSLLFAYMKLLNVKDLEPVKQELDRVKKYMNLAKQLDQKDEKKTNIEKEEQERAKKLIHSALDGRASGPAISRVNFEGKHTKFEDPKDQEKLAEDVRKQTKPGKPSSQAKHVNVKGKITKNRRS